MYVWTHTRKFVLFWIGQRFDDAFSEVDDVLGQLSFHLLPMKVQQMLPIVIQHSQKPGFVKFFGSLSATREQFKKVGAPNGKPICHQAGNQFH